jgi:hypothetical protein
MMTNQSSSDGISSLQSPPLPVCFSGNKAAVDGSQERWPICWLVSPDSRKSIISPGENGTLPIALQIRVSIITLHFLIFVYRSSL